LNKLKVVGFRVTRFWDTYIYRIWDMS